MEEENIEDTGETPFDGADDANIPVDIWLTFDKEEEKFNLRASNYCPRKTNVYEGAYESTSTESKKLQEIIKNKIIPLYETALRKLNLMANATEEQVKNQNNLHLYYWD